MPNTSESCAVFGLEDVFLHLTLQAANLTYTWMLQLPRKSHRQVENIEISATYSGTAVTKVNHLPYAKCFWQFHFKQIKCSFMNLLFFSSAFVRLFKHTALSHAYKFADSYHNYCCCFNVRELLSLVRINA